MIVSELNNLPQKLNTRYYYFLRFAKRFQFNFLFYYQKKPTEIFSRLSRKPQSQQHSHMQFKNGVFITSNFFVFHLFLFCVLQRRRFTV